MDKMQRLQNLMLNNLPMNFAGETNIDAFN